MSFVYSSVFDPQIHVALKNASDVVKEQVERKGYKIHRATGAVLSIDNGVAYHLLKPILDRKSSSKSKINDLEFGIPYLNFLDSYEIDLL